MTQRDIPKIFLLVSFAGLFFTYGLIVATFEVFPYSIINYVKDSIVTVYSERDTLLGLRPSQYLVPARHEGAGVTVFEADAAAPGLTFIAGFFDDSIGLRLLRLDGSIVNSWPVQFYDIFPNPNHLEGRPPPGTNWNVEIDGALAMPDGSVVFNFAGYGMVKLDRCGTVQWTVPKMTHHSIDQSTDGGFWVPGSHWVQGDSEFPPLSVPYREDTILKISPDGEVLTEISVPGLLFKNNLQALYFANGVGSLRNLNEDSELVHLNDIEELDRARADRFPEFAAGDLVVSLRNLNLVFVVDPATQNIKWHQTGPWIRQHDPDFTDRGTISIYNNNLDNTPDGSLFGGSNIVEVDPVTGESTIRFGAEAGQYMYSPGQGKHQIIEFGERSGNILITEPNGGRIFEVDPDGKVVWQFINRYDDETLATVTKAIRYPEDYFKVDDWSCS